MIKHVFLCVVMCLSCNLHGQTFRFGGISGLNISKLTGNDNPEYNYLGFKIGGRIATDLRRQFRTSIDLLYSRSGNVVSLGQTNFSFENIRLDYVETPLMFTFMDWMDDPDEEEYYRLHFSIGFSFAKLVNHNVRNNLDINVSDQQSFNKNKISLLAGLVYYVNQHLGVNVQYSNSFSNIQKLESKPKMKSRIWSINIMYMLDNKRR